MPNAQKHHFSTDREASFKLFVKTRLVAARGAVTEAAGTTLVRVVLRDLGNVDGD